MPDPCQEMLPGCAREFGEIQTTQQEQSEKLDKVILLLQGNGSPVNSVTGRLQAVEIAASELKSRPGRIISLVLTATSLIGCATAIIVAIYK